MRGYQAALAWIHREAAGIPLSPETVLKLHALARPGLWDSGCLKDKDGEIIERHADGRVSLRFKPLSAKETPAAMAGLCRLATELLRDRQVPPLIVWAAVSFDFLCIHPFRDGNGRVSRLLLLLQLYHLGFTAGRYISLERIIEQSKDRYYETLRQSSVGWHEGRHDPWPHVNYLLFTLKELYAEFERRYGDTTLPPGEKTETVRAAVARFREPFHITELRKQCPEVSQDMIRKVLKDLRTAGVVQCTGRGKHARWRVIG
ncbi:MAG: hypothetical protein A3K19_20435 [Lentisphaerae bacterium RIFOXYB12_FULL_65_16]|nr:MAG: hypothetical protein A3K18_32685 [Lentisphaerae bacterium RIFOXYA12_64_32]OGV89329.1 MAG: hypothetical protein A3K19_20435 [Lentisphaerae bacterium RIFOXYB12_FULL_65_16]